MCKDCLSEMFYKPLEDRRLKKDKYCIHCGIPLVSEKEVCTKCHATLNDGKIIERQFLLYPYINNYTNIVLYWKNENIRSLSLLFALIIKQFIKNNPELVEKIRAETDAASLLAPADEQKNTDYSRSLF